MRRSGPVHPEAFIEAGVIDDQRVAVPVASRIAVVAGNEILWVRFAVQRYGSVCVRPADVEDQDSLKLGHLDDLRSVRSYKLPCTARRLAACVWFEFVIAAIVVECLGPRLVRCLSI